MSHSGNEKRMEDVYEDKIEESIMKGLPEEEARKKADEFTQQPDWWIGGND